MSEWKEYKLSDIAEILNNKRVPLSSQVRSKRKGKFAYYGASGIVDWIDNFIFDGEYVLISEDGENLRSRNTPIAFKANGKFWVNNHAHILKGKEPYLNDWIVYYFKNLDINPFITGAVQPKLNKENLLRIPIRMPDLKTVEMIAEILSSLDDKIELNNKINQELEALAQALFKRWFVDFEFPNENGEPYKSSGGDMVDSELGEIPKGWEVNTLDDISKITIGRTPPRQEHQWFSTDSNDVKWISIRDMGNCGTFIHTTSEFLTEDAIEKFNIPSIEPHTVIMSFKLTVGRISITTERMLSNEAIAHLNLTNSEIYPEFLYLFLKQFNFDSLGSTSSIATAVNTKSIKSLPFIHPDIELLSKFNGVITPLFSRIHNLTFENNELTNLRDTLLPKLISGELEINEITH